MKDDSYVDALLEEIRDQNKVVMEAVSQMKEQMVALATKDDLRRVADDVTTIKTVLTETNEELADHEHRVTLLEQAA